jgi:molecular chaperone GrpE
VTAPAEWDFERDEPFEGAAVGGAGVTEGEAPTPEERVTQLTAELDALNQRYARAVADYQNLRRRVEETQREQARMAMAALVMNYLPVLDDLDRALESVKQHDEIAEHEWVEGVRMVQRKFRAILEASGIREIAETGVLFDPAIHEAVSHAPGPEETVVAVVRPGFHMNGHLVRPAMVIVGDGSPAEVAGTAHGERPNT